MAILRQTCQKNGRTWPSPHAFVETHSSPSGLPYTTNEWSKTSSTAVLIPSPVETWSRPRLPRCGSHSPSAGTLPGTGAERVEHTDEQAEDAQDVRWLLGGKAGFEDVRWFWRFGGLVLPKLTFVGFPERVFWSGFWFLMVPDGSTCNMSSSKDSLMIVVNM